MSFKLRMISLAAVAAGLVTLAGAPANARRLTAAFGGAPDGNGSANKSGMEEGNCWWAGGGARLMLRSACWNNAPHFFQVNLPIDSATLVTARRFQSTTSTASITFGSVCSRGVTYDQTGALTQSQPTDCSNGGTIGSTSISVPTNGTAALAIWMSAASNSGSDKYVSWVSYTP